MFLTKRSKVKSSLFEKMSFGSVCIALPLVYYYQDILSPLSLSESGTYLSFIDRIRWPLILGILLSTVLILLFRRKQGTLSIEKFIKIVLGLSQILIGYYFLGFTAGFTVYFLIHHTTNSFNHQYKWLKKKIARSSNENDVSKYFGLLFLSSFLHCKKLDTVKKTINNVILFIFLF